MDHGGMHHGGGGGMGDGGDGSCLPGAHHCAPAPPCKMNMLWNSDATNVCIIFPSWQITTGATLLGSLVVIVLLGIAYEYVRLSIRTLDARLAAAHGLGAGAQSGGVHRRRASVLPTSASGAAMGNGLPSALGSGMRRTLSGRDEDAHSGAVARRRGIIPPLLIPPRAQMLRSALYGVSVALSMTLMLIFMTYNAQLIAAVLAGAVLGHYLFSRDLQHQVGDGVDKGVGCH